MKQTNRPPLPKDPSGRIGVYKCLAEVPQKYRLGNYESEYRGRDCWGEFLEYEMERFGYGSDHYLRNSRTCERYWKAHMDDVGRHPALAMPKDFDTFFEDLLGRMNRTTAYNNYWSRLESFYDFLLWHIDHPHVYQPVLMSAIEYETAGSIWERKIEVNHE